MIRCTPGPGRSAVPVATAMTRIIDKSSRDRPELLAPVALALGAAGATGLLSFSHAEVFRPYFGHVHPLLAIVPIGVLGILALRVLSQRWKLKLSAGKENWRGARNSSLLATLFAVPSILIDRIVTFPYHHVPPPVSLLFYPTIAYVAEIVFHAVPLLILLGFLGPLFKEWDATRLVWICIVLASSPEPIFQLNYRPAGAPFSWVDAYVGLHVFAFNVMQFRVFRRYGFVSMYVCRLAYYIEWHMIWGYVR